MDMDVNSGRSVLSGRHVLIVLLCCLLPVAAVGAVWALDIPLSSMFVFGLLLLCPLGHLLMMRGGHQHH
jgi:hypothetical protein